MRIKHKKSVKNTPKKGNVFPLWALFISLGCIGVTGLFLSSRLANVKKTIISEDYSLFLK
jgi:hypothetical protein